MATHTSAGPIIHQRMIDRARRERAHLSVVINASGGGNIYKCLPNSTARIYIGPFPADHRQQVVDQVEEFNKQQMREVFASKVKPATADQLSLDIPLSRTAGRSIHFPAA